MVVVKAARATRIVAMALLCTRFAVNLPMRAAMPGTGAADVRVSQYDLEAVYLFNFAKFVRWPDGAASDGAFDLCLAGAPRSFNDTLNKTVQGETMNGRALRVRDVSQPGELSGCDILYLDASAKDLPGFIAASARQPMLTVSDAPEFLKNGGMLQFVLVDNRVRFNVNLIPVRRTGLSLSAELLRVALNVSGAGAPQ
jgi:hypothetical protein